MRKFKYLISVLIIGGGLFFLFSPEVLPENWQFQEFLNLSTQSDIIIVFNSGGWGNTPLREAEDFAPIIEGIQEKLTEWGYTSLVVPYQRTKDNFWGRIAGLKGTIFSYKKQTYILSKDIEEFLKKNPSKKIIMTGLSNGAAFADETMEEISNNIKNNVYAVEVGIPFWKKKINSENILRLDNKGNDPLVKGEADVLLFSLFKAPLKWLSSKFSEKNIKFSQAFYMPGHDYSWSKVESDITSFLAEKLK